MSDNFDQNIEQKRSITEKYRLAVIDEENLKEVNSFRVSLLNIYILFSTIILLLGAILLSLIFFTPLKRLVPGYGDVSESQEYRILAGKVKEMEEAMEVQELYNESLKRMIQGNISGDIEINQNESLLNEVKNNIEDSKAGTISPEEIHDTKSTRLLGSLLFVPPVTGSISAGFLDVKSHLGVDVLAPKDTPILSIMDGIVVFSDWTMEAGNTIAIQHDNNIVSLYKHNSTLFKKPGDRVNSGEAIAVIGNTGTLTDGPHLHFELWYDGYPVDPEKFINFN